VKFGSQDLKIWQFAMEITDELFDIAVFLEEKKLFGFSEQLCGSAMSMTNNISESSGSTSNKEFKYFLNIARRSTFENANILMILYRRKLITEETLNRLLEKLDKECRMITNFKKTL
jgi:four helix bundle protein